MEPPNIRKGIPSSRNWDFSVCKPRVLPHSPRGVSSLQLNLEEKRRCVSSQSWGRNVSSSLCLTQQGQPQATLLAIQSTEIVHKALSQLGDLPKCRFKSISLAASSLNPQATLSHSTTDTAQAQSMKPTCWNHGWTSFHSQDSQTLL